MWGKAKTVAGLARDAIGALADVTTDSSRRYVALRREEWDPR
jgi:hypothetical protein